MRLIETSGSYSKFTLPKSKDNDIDKVWIIPVRISTLVKNRL